MRMARRSSVCRSRIRHRPAGRATGALTYPAATLDKNKAHLTVRALYSDAPRHAGTAGSTRRPRIRLVPQGTAFQPGSLYEFTTGKNPRVAGLASRGCATLADFLHNATAGRSGTVNPLAGDVRAIYAFCYSQPCRAMHDFPTSASTSRPRRTAPSTGSRAGRRRLRRLLQLSLRPARPHDAPAHRPLVPGTAVPVRERGDDGPGDGADRWSSCVDARSERHVPEDLRGELRDRVLEQGGLAADHRHAGQRPRPGQDAERALLPPVEPPAQRGRDRTRGTCQQPQNPLLPNPSHARSSSISTSG